MSVMSQWFEFSKNDEELINTTVNAKNGKLDTFV